MDNKTIINSPNAPAPIGPYSQGVLVDQTLYISGQIAINPSTGELMVDDITTEISQVMKNIQAILEVAEMSFDQVVKCTIFVKDLGDFSIINETYGTFFGKNAPARETVEVSRLPKDVNLEISCIACK